MALTLASSSFALQAASQTSGFSGFDDRLADGRSGFVVLRAESEEIVQAMLAHAARRLSATGTLVVRAVRRPGASMVRQLGEKLGRLKTDFQEVVGLARNLAGEKFAGIRDCAMDGGKAAVSKVTKTIEGNPIRSAIVAVGVGALIGFLIARR